MIHATVTRLRLHPSTTHLIAFHNYPHDCPVRQKRFKCKWKTKCAWSFQTRLGTPIFPIMAKTTSHTIMSKLLDESIASVTTPSSSPSIANSTVHTQYCMRFSGMHPATDLGNQVLHHLITSTKRVPAYKLYRRHVTVIGRMSSGVGV